MKTSRVTVTAAAPLNDYSAYSVGNRFYVDVPASSAPRIERGSGVNNVKLLKRGDRTVIEFTLPPGTSARVNQKFNNLDVIIQQPAAASAGSPESPRAAAPAAAVTPAPRTASPTPRATSQSSPLPQSSAVNANQSEETIVANGALDALNLDQSSTGQSRTAADSRQQTPPASPPAANVETAPLSTDTTGARLVRNWPLVLVAVLLLSGVVWLIAARLRPAPSTRRPAISQTTPAPSRVDAESVAAQESSASVAVAAAPVEHKEVQSVASNEIANQLKPLESVSRPTAPRRRHDPPGGHRSRTARPTDVRRSIDRRGSGHHERRRIINGCSTPRRAAHRGGN